MNVHIEGKNVQLLGDPMLNNCSAGGSPPNSATLMGVINPDGSVIAVEAGKCPICEKAEGHGALQESQQSKADAGSLAKSFEKQVDAASEKGAAKVPKVSVSANTMLGVVICQCDRKYADQSAMTTVELCNAASEAGMKSPPGITLSYADGRNALDQGYLETLNKVKKRLEELLGNSSVFRRAWGKAEERARQSDANRQGPAAYPPGTCAAQKALLLLMDEGALPAAMTEQWFSSKNQPTQASVKYIQIDPSTANRESKVGKFDPGQTVPPCGTCEIILPLLLCDRGKLSCEHSS